MKKRWNFTANMNNIRKKRLKILYIGSIDNPLFYNWARWFVNKGHKVGVVGENNNTSLNINFYNISYPPKNPRDHKGFLGVLYQLIKLKYAIKNFKPDILHSHQVRLHGLLGAFSGFHPHITSAWGSDIYIQAQSSYLEKYLVSYTLKHCDLLTFESTSLGKKCYEIGALKEKSEQILFGINLESFSPGNTSDEILNKYNLCNKKIVLSTRRLGNLYNIDVILKSVPIVISKIPNAMFVIKYPRGENPNKLKKLANSLNINDYVIFIADIDYEQLPKFYSLSDLFVSIPSSDSISVSLMEAMACGISPIVSDISANREIIKNSYNGLIIPVRDYNALSDAIIDLLSNENERNQFAKRNRKIAINNFGIDSNMSKIENIYYSLLKIQKY